MRRDVRLPLDAGGRLDRAVADALGVGRAAVKQAFAAGRVRVEGRRARGRDPAVPGALVEVEVESPLAPPSPDPDMPVRILAEGPGWLVADKPAGIATHPLRAGETGTLANGIVARYPECAEASPDPRDDAVDDSTKITLADKRRIHPGESAGPLDEDALGTVHHDLGDALVG